MLTEQPVVGAGVCALVSDDLDAEVGSAGDVLARGDDLDAVVVDALLFRPGPGETELRRVLASTQVPVLVLTRELRPGLNDRALDAGARVFASLHAGADELVRAVSGVAAATSHHGRAANDTGTAITLQEQTGLSGRQIDVLRLIAAGHSNAEISRRLFVSINSTKTYIRGAYRAIGATTRSQAVVWAVDNGLGPVDVREPA